MEATSRHQNNDKASSSNVCLSRLLTLAFLAKSFMLFVGLQYATPPEANGKKADRSALLFPPGIIGGLVLATWGLLICAPKECKLEYRNGAGCTKCGHVVEPNSKHCADCRVCVRGHMFHARWAGICIGSRNSKEYLGWLASIILYFSCLIVLWVSQLILFLKNLKNQKDASEGTKLLQETLNALGLLCLAVDATALSLTIRELIKLLSLKWNFRWLQCLNCCGKKKVASAGRGVFFNRSKRGSPPVLQMEAVLAGMVPAPDVTGRDSIDLQANPGNLVHDVTTSERGSHDCNESRAMRYKILWRRLSRRNSTEL